MLFFVSHLYRNMLQNTYTPIPTQASISSTNELKILYLNAYIKSYLIKNSDFEMHQRFQLYQPIYKNT